jgi:hypothetical protein
MRISVRVLLAAVGLSATTTQAFTSPLPVSRRTATTTTTSSQIGVSGRGWDNDNFMDSLGGDEEAQQRANEEYFRKSRYGQPDEGYLDDAKREPGEGGAVPPPPTSKPGELPSDDISGAQLTEEMKARVKASHTPDEEASQGGQMFKNLMARAQDDPRPIPPELAAPIVPPPPPAFVPPPPPPMPVDMNTMSVEEQARMFREMMMQQQQQMPPPPNPYAPQQQQQMPPQQNMPAASPAQQMPPPPKPYAYAQAAQPPPLDPNAAYPAPAPAHYLGPGVAPDGRKIGRNKDSDAINNSADVYFAQLKRDSSTRNQARYSGNADVADAVFSDPAIHEIKLIVNPHLEEQKKKEMDLMDTMGQPELIYYDREPEEVKPENYAGISYKEKMAMLKAKTFPAPDALDTTKAEATEPVAAEAPVPFRPPAAPEPVTPPAPVVVPPPAPIAQAPVPAAPTTAPTWVPAPPPAAVPESSSAAPTRVPYRAPEPVKEPEAPPRIPYRAPKPEPVAEVPAPIPVPVTPPPVAEAPTRVPYRAPEAVAEPEPATAARVPYRAPAVEETPAPVTPISPPVVPTLSGDTRQDIRTLMGLMLKHRGGPGFGAGRLQGTEAEKLELLATKIADILRQEEPREVAAIVEPPAVETPPPVASPVAGQDDRVKGMIACVEGAVTMFKTSPPELQGSVLVTLRAALLASIQTCNEVLVNSPESSINVPAIARAPATSQSDRITSMLAYLEAATSMYKNAPAELQGTVLVTTRVALLSAVSTCNDVIGDGTDNTPPATDAVAVAPPAPEVEEPPTGNDANSQMLQEIYERLKSAGGNGKMGLDASLSAADAKELKDALSDMRTLLVDELHSGIPAPSEEGATPEGSSKSFMSLYQKMLGKSREEKEEGKDGFQ